MAITITAPPAGSPLAPFDFVEVYVVATTTPLERVVLWMELPGLGRSELVHDGR